MTSNITVLKFGGSVLRNEDDLPKAVHEIYRYWRHGEQVLVVVSAFNGKTDELIANAQSYVDVPDPGLVASFLYTGEAASSSLLALALNRAGIPVRLLSPEQAGIRTGGDSLDAEPVSADCDRIRKELEGAVVVLSGFVGTDRDGNLTLLGRGGTDLTALFLAERLDASCRLIKDVDGLYESDPANGAKPDKFARAHYRTALKVGRRLVQPKAVRFAQEREQEFEISSFASTDSTTIGDHSDQLASTTNKKPRPLRVALLGCGTVGGGVYQRLKTSPDLFELIGVANLDSEKALAAGIEYSLNTQNARSLIEQDCDGVLELIGGIEPARSYVKHALSLGRHVVTANKALIATHGDELEDIALRNDVTIRYSASVGGVMPALENLSRIVSDEPIRAITGIVNGTCNFICDRLSEGVNFEAAVRAAQEAGFAESDPRLDLDGTDAAQKLVLLAKAAFGARLPFESIDRVGIDSLDETQADDARQRGRFFRLVANVQRTNKGIEASVRPVEVPVSHPFAFIKGAENCLLIECESGRQRFIRGRGAGRYATTESVIADLFDLRHEISKNNQPQESKIIAWRFAYENGNALCVAG